MANKVAGELYETLTGQLFEIGRQLRQPNGYPFDPSRLKDHLQAVIEGKFFQVSGSFRFDKRKDGWTLLENISRRLTSAKIDVISFLKSGETVINGKEMVLRARTELNANYGQEDAEWLLKHQDKISAELRKFFLVFPGTIWRDLNDHRNVPVLRWCGDRWALDLFLLDNDWNSNDRLVVPRR